MTSPSWTILIATIGRRIESLNQLLTCVLPQTESHRGSVRVLALWNNGEQRLADVRQALVDEATSDYVSFVDDDDELPDDHVQRVVCALATRPDYVGWAMQCYRDGVALKPTFHSLEYTGWFEDDVAYYRDVSHLNPVKRELALRCDFRRTEPPEDVAWATQLRPHVRSQEYIPDVMYCYHSSSADSTWQPGSVRPEGFTRATVEHPNFAWHPWSFVHD